MIFGGRMAHIQLPQGMPGIVGALAFRPETMNALSVSSRTTPRQRTRISLIASRNESEQINLLCSSYGSNCDHAAFLCAGYSGFLACPFVKSLQYRFIRYLEHIHLVTKQQRILGSL
jgi:hypothetical protein